MSFIDTVLVAQDWITHYAVQPLLILFIGVFVGKLAEQLLLFTFAEFKREGHGYEVTANLVKWAAYIAAVLLAIHSIGVLTVVLWFLAGVAVTLAALRIVLGLKDFFPNFFHYHGLKAKYKRGSQVKLSFGEAKIVAVHLLDVHVKMASGDDVFVPNIAFARFVQKS